VGPQHPKHILSFCDGSKRLVNAVKERECNFGWDFLKAVIVYVSAFNEKTVKLSGNKMDCKTSSFCSNILPSSPIVAKPFH
jgi:hypothetical protein